MEKAGRDVPFKQSYRDLSVLLCAVLNRPESSTPPVAPESDVRPLDVAGCPEEILEVLPLEVEG